MNTPTTKKKKDPSNSESRSPLLGLAVILSVASATWTAYSCWDLLDRHPMALVAGGTYDILWLSLVYTDWRNRVTGKKTWGLPGWAMLVPVVFLLTWHGLEAWGLAGAIAGPLLALGTKVLWLKAIEDSIDEVVIKKNAAAKTLNLLETETEIILETAGAEIRKEEAESEAEHQRALAEKRRSHELKMAALAYEDEEKQAALDSRNTRMVKQVENSSMERLFAHLERLSNPQSTTIPGETVESTSAPKALTSRQVQRATNEGRAGMLTVHINNKKQGAPLTEAQENRKRLAALFYLYSDEAKKRGERLTQYAFAERMETTGVQVSRSCSDFPRSSFGSDIESYREEMDEAG